METIAILAPTAVEVTPEQSERARTAIYQQMMLIARGLPIDHPAVRGAAEIVASAVTADPVEVALADRGPSQDHDHGRDARQPARQYACPSEADPPAPAPRGPAGRSAAYARYLETIFSTQPS